MYKTKAVYDIFTTNYYNFSLSWKQKKKKQQPTIDQPATKKQLHLVIYKLYVIDVLLFVCFSVNAVAVAVAAVTI